MVSSENGQAAVKTISLKTDEQPTSPSAKSEKSEKTINKRLQRTQAQVNEVVDIMRVNIEKVLERDKNLSQLDDRADALQAGASQFEASAGKLKRKFWWRNCKLLIVLIGLIGFIGIVLIVSLTSGKRYADRVNGSYHLDGNFSQKYFPNTNSPSRNLMPSGQEGLPPWSSKPQTQPRPLNMVFKQNETNYPPELLSPSSSSSMSDYAENYLPSSSENVPPLELNNT